MPILTAAGRRLNGAPAPHETRPASRLPAASQSHNAQVLTGRRRRQVLVAVLDARIRPGDQLGVLDHFVSRAEAAAVGDEYRRAALDAEFAGFGGRRRAGRQPVFAPGRPEAAQVAGGLAHLQQSGPCFRERSGVPGSQQGHGAAVLDGGLTAADDLIERSGPELGGDGGRRLGDPGFQYLRFRAGPGGSARSERDQDGSTAATRRIRPKIT